VTPNVELVHRGFDALEFFPALNEWTLVLVSDDDRRKFLKSNQFVFAGITNPIRLFSTESTPKFFKRQFML